MKLHFEKGEEIRIIITEYGNRCKVGQIGKITDFMWDYPSWEYRIQFDNGSTCRVWDYQVEATSGKKLDNSEFTHEVMGYERDGQRGYVE